MCWHCWHHLEGTRRKIKSDSTCNRSNPYISSSWADSPHVKYIMKKECCKCGIIKDTEIYRDYQIDRGLEYPPLQSEV